MAKSNALVCFDGRSQYLRIKRTLCQGKDVSSDDTPTLTNGHEHWNPCSFLCLRPQIVCNYEFESAINDVYKQSHLHQEIIIPIVVYVPLTIQKVAK